MALGNLKVKASDRGVLRSLERLRGSFSDLRPALGNAAKELTRRVWYRFAFKRDPDGKAWPQWAASTRARYKGDPRRKLMLHTRALRDRSRFEPGRTAMRAVIGTPYGIKHEQPNGPGTGKLPRRAFMFSLRNGRRALAVNDEKYLLSALGYQLRKAAKGR